ncbi:GntR family transcriptional regulator [Pararhodobacter sp. CCB-MM2]|uniref:GntR family transcriptional regulator n=1 Tax=Pararhodobacter sp. CCB-MM2 TaxID=1786003 RepID=UPI0008329B4C|nr:GntR family transcriptional regulator [Pararhodobacter sp. CCB-MM2]
MRAITGWQEARDEALARIRARDWAPGERIPDEVALAEAWGCARATVNRALRDLAEQGYLERRRKGGTRVPLTPVRRATLTIPIIRQDIEERGQKPGYRLLSDLVETPPETLQQIMGTLPLRHIRALHLADDAPYCLEDRWLNPAVSEDVDFTALSPNEWLVGNVSYSEGTLAFHALPADAAHAEALNCAPGTALLALDRSTRAETPITWVRLTYAPGHRVEAGL